MAELIKGEKVRKAVRAWAEANHLGDAELYFSVPFSRTIRINWLAKKIDFSNDGSFGEINFARGYTVDELCGEEGK